MATATSSREAAATYIIRILAGYLAWASTWPSPSSEKDVIWP